MSEPEDFYATPYDDGRDYLDSGGICAGIEPCRDLDFRSYMDAAMHSADGVLQVYVTAHESPRMVTETYPCYWSDGVQRRGAVIAHEVDPGETLSEVFAEIVLRLERAGWAHGPVSSNGGAA